MAYVWFLAFLVVLFWAIHETQQAAKLKRSNAATAAQWSALQAQNQALYADNQALHWSNQRLQADGDMLRAHLNASLAENVVLGRYRPLVDVEREIAQRRAGIAAAERAADQEATAVVATAREQAATIIAGAHGTAQEIAAEALEAKRNVETYRGEAIALKNVIEGYGERYLIATDTVLDGLAESFAHTDGGAKLKEARQKSRAMIRSGQAATCDYVEDDRRRAAIEFVIDAFNGKVDSILAKAKSDNYGALLQQLRDAAALVNKNGRAFRSARLQPAYV